MIRYFFAEEGVTWTIYVLALVAHLLVFGALLHFYGPSSFFLSTDGSLNGNDSQHYVIIAKNIAEGHGYSRFVDLPFEPDGLRTPLLPLYFLPFVGAGGLSLIWLAMLILNFILALAPVIFYKLSRMFLPHSYAVAGGLFLVFEPLFLYRSQIAEPDALLVLLLVSAMYFLARSWKLPSSKDWYAATALLGISILAKPSALYVAVLVFIFQFAFIISFARPISWKQVTNLCIGVLITFAIISPWLIRNHQVFGVWGVSSVSGYNLYEYYTAHIKMADEVIPEAIQNGSREPSRYLPYQKYFANVALERIAHQPAAYAKEQAVGSIRNLFVSDLPAIYYYGHSRLLPFPYNPESKTNMPKILWAGALALAYVFALIGWLSAYKRDRITFFAFTLYLALFAYFIISSGPFVDAKYRLPALSLVIVVALYGVDFLTNRFLRKSPN
ncbi:glycosyltransferase family 39 protein [Candidatus Kaiserbacteria bacterium]|nr:glycosyltransferase family 39 protein [Candidatus Kaiserbacteria bacterium]